MNTNRLDHVADRQRVNTIRDILFVIAVAVILIFQIVSLSQARAFSQTFWLGEDKVQDIRVAQPIECNDNATEKLAVLPGRADYC